MEKIMIPPLDSNAAEVIKNNWAKMVSWRKWLKNMLP